MLTTLERRKEIVQLAQSEGKVLVDDLATKYAVSTVTIRNDLNELDKTGLLVRCRGGALTSTRLSRELSVQEKHKERLPVKRRLGVAVADLISDGESIILDSGTTTEEVAHALSRHQNLTVMTNGLNVAMALAKNEGVEVSMTGGTLRKKSMSFSGRQAEDSLKHLHFDKLILGVDGFDAKAGLTTFFEPEASLNRLMCEVASEVIVITDSSKFDLRGYHVIRPFTAISALVTDTGIPSSYVEALKQAGVITHLVEV